MVDTPSWLHAFSTLQDFQCIIVQNKAENAKRCLIQIKDQLAKRKMQKDYAGASQIWIIDRAGNDQLDPWIEYIPEQKNENQA